MRRHGPTFLRVSSGATRRRRWMLSGAAAVVVLVAGASAPATAARRPTETGHRPSSVRHTATLTASTDEPTSATRGADGSRTSWYPGESNLGPALVGGGTFGQLFSTSVNGSVYGQPLVDDGQLLVNTENNVSYGLNPVTGAILWSATPA